MNRIVQLGAARLLKPDERFSVEEVTSRLEAEIVAADLHRPKALSWSSPVRARHADPDQALSATAAIDTHTGPRPTTGGQPVEFMAAQTVRGVHDFNRIVDADGCPKACNDARGTVLEFSRAR